MNRTHSVDIDTLYHTRLRKSAVLLGVVSVSQSW